MRHYDGFSVVEALELEQVGAASGAVGGGGAAQHQALAALLDHSRRWCAGVAR